MGCSRNAKAADMPAMAAPGRVANADQVDLAPAKGDLDGGEVLRGDHEIIGQVVRHPIVGEAPDRRVDQDQGLRGLAQGTATASGGRAGIGGAGRKACSIGIEHARSPC